MKKIVAVLCFTMAFAISVFAQTVDPCTQSTALSNPSKVITNNGTGTLSGSGSTQIHYEMWTDGGQTGNNKLSWYGSDKGGGAAFKAEWANPNDYLGRVGYYWGNGNAYTSYKNIYVDYNYKGRKTGSGGSYSYIGIYGWSRNSSASDNNRKLIEYYIIDDWFGSGQLGTATTGGSKVGEYTLDGGTYYVITNIRYNKPSIDGDKTFTQYFAIRQGMGSNTRQCGTYSVTEHFKKWDAMNLKLGNMYEAKFLVEAGGGTGSVDLTYLKFSQEDQPRGSTGTTSSNSTGGASSSSKASSSSMAAASPTCNDYQSSFCGGIAWADVKGGSTDVPTEGKCLYIGDFGTIQPNLSSTVAINGVENVCGDAWSSCGYNEKPAAKDGGYYVYVKKGTINIYENNGWKDIVPKPKPTCSAPPATPSSSSKASSSSVAASSSSSKASSSSVAASSSSSSKASSSSVAASSSSSSAASSSSEASVASSSSESEEDSSSSSEGEDVTPISNPQLSIQNSKPPTYFSLKGEPLGNAKPQKAGIYIVKQGSSVSKIVVR